MNLWLQAWLKRLQQLPQALRQQRAQRLREKVLAQGEVERLDRIRKPWKYRGK